MWKVRSARGWGELWGVGEGLWWECEIVVGVVDWVVWDVEECWWLWNEWKMSILSWRVCVIVDCDAEHYAEIFRFLSSIFSKIPPILSGFCLKVSTLYTYKVYWLDINIQNLDCTQYNCVYNIYILLGCGLYRLVQSNDNRLKIDMCLIFSLLILNFYLSNIKLYPSKLNTTNT